MSIVFTDVRVFDGETDALSGPATVVIEGNRITAVSERESAAPTDAEVVAGNGRTLIPGLIDAHVHLAFSPLPELLDADPMYLAAASLHAAGAMLQRGFTSVRDLGGPVFGVKRAIDEGLFPGPRIWPSDAFLSQTSGHGDLRARAEIPRGALGRLSAGELHGHAVIADGVPEVLRGVREQLRHGASQIKVLAGGGVASPHDPLDVTQFTEDELRAAVGAASDWGTYVTAHAYTPAAVQRALRAGVRCIEHGHLLDDATVAELAAAGAWWSLQPFGDGAHPPPPSGKGRAVAEGTDRAYLLAREHGVNLAWGTDSILGFGDGSDQGAALSKLTRWFSSAEILRMATSGNARLLALSGDRSPYPGPLGVIRAGALADVLLVDGDPTRDVGVLAHPESIHVIVKDGVVQNGG